MSRKIISEDDGIVTTATTTLKFSADTPQEVAEAELENTLSLDSLTPKRETTTLEAIVLLRPEHGGKECLLTNVKDYKFDMEDRCTAVVFDDGTLELFTDTVPLKPEHANHTIEELRKQRNPD